MGGIEEVDGGALPGKRMGMQDDEDAGIGDDRCKPPARSECDPVAKCGCPTGQQCQYVVGAGAKCYAVTPNRPREGERCSISSPCADGLECPFTGLCARPCTSNEECSEGSCALLAAPLATAGVKVCVQSCDPVTGVACDIANGSTCLPTQDPSQLASALCTGIRPKERVAKGNGVNEACMLHTDCAPGLGCLATQMDGTGLCAPWCRSNDDCPVSRAMCQLQTNWYYASEGDPVGLCIPVQSGTITDANCTITEPAPWTGGPVWSVSDLTECLSTCPEGDNACVAAMCPSGADFVACTLATLAACSGGSAGHCRPEYTGATCCQQQFCTGAADLNACNQMYCADEMASWSMCATNDESCTNDLLSVCVE